MRKFQLLLAAVCLLVPITFAGTDDLTFTSPESMGMDSSRLNVIDRIIQDAIDAGEIPMGAALVARHGKIVFHKFHGFADVASQKSLDDDAIFRIASMTKAVTSVAAMILLEEGRYLLNDPLSKYIPAFANSKVADVSGDEVTVRDAASPILVRHVMTHQAGMIYQPFFTGPLADIYLENGVAEIFPFRRDETLEDYVNRYASLPMYTDPGGEVTYGVATDVLGRLVEVWSGQRLGDFCRERIFEPLGMDDTSFFLPDGSDKVARIPTMYTQLADGSYELRETPEVGTEITGSRLLDCGAAGLLSTPSDYFRFCQMILNEGTYNGHRILSRRSIAAMTQNQVGDTTLPDFLRILGDKTGFGLGIRTETGAWEGLESPGTLSFAGIYWTRYWIDPAEDLVIIAMTQAYTLDQSGFAHKVKNAAYQALVSSGKPLETRFKK